MHMSKYHQNALVLLGITVCAGLLLTAPAAAGSGQGLASLESGELLPLALKELPVARSSPEPSGDPVLPVNGTSDVVSILQDDAADLSEENTTSITLTSPENETETALPAVTESYDDERLAGLVDTASIRLMRLSMEHAHALYLQDEDAAAIAADDLYAFSVRLLNEVQPLRVSPERQPFKDEFVRSLEAYSRASSKLLSPADAGEDAVPAAFSDMAAASENLEAVSREAGEIQSGSLRTATTTNTPLAARATGILAGTGPIVVPPSGEALRLLERHAYDDPAGENMASILVEFTRTAKAYQEVPGTRSTPTIEAGEGRVFLLVAVKSTNLGHKGDSDLYVIETPARSAFTLEYGEAMFTPLDVPPFTTLGESFNGKQLERYESLKGYLYFDVPDTFEVAGATLRADLGYAGTPVWRLDERVGDEDAL
ncbi:MAG: hypothetical protein GX837_04785 [Methanomicrobiales archaeon]|nr:hypothetical protein [Methanomicrobiales archaeon]